MGAGTSSEETAARPSPADDRREQREDPRGAGEAESQNRLGAHEGDELGRGDHLPARAGNRRKGTLNGLRTRTNARHTKPIH